MIGMLEMILRRPRTVIVMMLVVVGAGVLSYLAIPKEANPDIDVPVFYVSVGQNGVSPEDAERLLIRPLETQLQGLDGLVEITAIASEGHAGVVLEFDISFDKDEAMADVRDRVSRAQAEMPTEADEAQIFETNFSLVPTITVALSGDVPERTLYGLARTLRDELENIDTILEANLVGHREEMLEVTIDLARLEAYGITQSQLLNALQLNNALVPAGVFDTGGGRFNVKVPGLIENADDLFSISLRENNDGQVLLGDVAEIRRTFQDPVSYTRVNGEPAIAIEVIKRLGTNIIENNLAVREAVDRVTTEWPEQVHIDYLVDMSDSINEVQGSLQASIVTAILLVMIVVLFALGLKSALLVGLAIPTSFMMGFLILSLAGQTVNIMVLFGLVLTVGLLVDGAIVVVEYADRKIAEGLEPTEAYIRAARLMFWPIVSSTATTLAAFLPMLLWPGVTGEFMGYLPLMVVIVLSAALLTAMVFLPVTGGLVGRAAHWMGRHALGIFSVLLSLAIATTAVTAIFGFVPPPPGISDLLLDVSAVFLPAAIVVSTILMLFEVPPGGSLFWIMVPATFFIPVTILALLVLPPLRALLAPLVRWQQKRAVVAEENRRAEALKLSAGEHFDAKKIKGLTGVYVRTLQDFATSKVGNVVAIGCVIAMAGISFVAFQRADTGFEFFVEEEPEISILLISGRGNLSAQETRDLVIEVESRIIDVAGIEALMTSTQPVGGSGGGGGDALGLTDVPPDMIGQIQIELADYSNRRTAAEIFAEIETLTADLAGIRTEIREIEGGPPTGKDVTLEMRGSNYDTLLETTRMVRAYIDTVEGLIDLEDDTPLPGIEWQIAIDREEAGRFGASVAEVGPMVQLVTTGVLIDTYRPDDTDEELDIRVRLPEEQRTLEQLDALRLETAHGQVPLSNFVTREPAQLVTSITRIDGAYSMNIKANAADGVDYNAKVAEIGAWLASQDLPQSVSYRFRGADEEQQESGQFLAQAMAGSLFLMFIILLTQFNSFYQTILTLGTVVLAVFGVLLGIAITGQSFSIIMTGTGIVALAGIVVNNAIVLMDTFNRFRDDGLETIEAALKAAAQRVRPILLTTITTIAGLIPMALQINLNFAERVIQIGSITSIWWVQLATAVISGLAFSTLLTLVIVPVMLCLPTVWAASFATWDRWLVDNAAPYRAVARAYGRNVQAPPAKGRSAKDAPDDGPANDDRRPELVPLPQAAE
ncbi:efflux RND transporter permease subunit [Ahrensia marina]|uniref:efflux RND transporter permease subunit n=1 Tax=Ahrensia marina TaxID=1514904 RepID=UPI0035D04572